jgi:hypothetical protein
VHGRARRRNSRSRRWMFAALFVCLAGIAFAAFGSTASASFPGANGRIAYVGNGGLFTILPTGTGNTLIAQNAGFPAWSPDGQRIAFVRGLVTAGQFQDEIYSMRANGTEVRRLTHNRVDDLAPAYSPSGRRIAFSSLAGIVDMRSDGTAQRVLSRRGAWPGYSPSADSIAFLVGSTAKRNTSIWVMHRNGTDKHRLVTLGNDGGSFGSYSPDGRHITFTRCGSECRYFVARSDGSNVRRLPCPPGYFRGTSAPTYSPNGRQLLGETGGPGSGQVDVVTLPLGSCSPETVVRLGANDAALPDWQPLPTG